MNNKNEENNLNDKNDMNNGYNFSLLIFYSQHSELLQLLQLSNGSTLTFYLRIFLTKATVKYDIINKPIKPSTAEIQRLIPFG